MFNQAAEKGLAGLVSTTSSAGAVGLTWLVNLNDILQAGATVVAIVAGIYAIVWHRARLRELAYKVYQRKRHNAQRKD